MELAPLAALVVAIGALILSTINTHRGARQSYVQQLEAQVAGLRADFQRCDEGRARQREDLDTSNREVSRLHRELEMAFIEIHELQRKGQASTYSADQLEAILKRLDLPSP